MKMRLMTFTCIAACTALPSCSDQGTTPEPGPIHSEIRQMPGCVHAGVAKTLSDQSCFTYAFTTNLDATWCLPANCCPDSGRFSLSSSIVKDTITVAVKDTAPNLCRCMCTYTVRATYSGLPLNRYVFLVRLADSIFYRETVYRTR
jgi:hypothetical protein